MEGLVALGLASNVVQFIDFAAKLCARIDDFSSAAGKAPGKIQSIADRLSLTIKTLESLDPESVTAMNDNNRNTLEACTNQMNELDRIVAGYTVQQTRDEASPWHKGVKNVEKSWKAFKSLRADDKIEELEKGLDRLLNLLSLQLQVSTASKSDNQNDEILRQIVTLRLDSVPKPVTTREHDIPVTVLPFHRNSRFIGRAGLLDQIDLKFSSGQPSVALCGLGGVGKSQIAIEYAFRFRERLPQASIFWVYTSAGVNFEQAYGNIAVSCQIPGLKESEQNTMQLVKDWLENIYSLEWLMIIDNVDNAEAFFTEKVHGKPLVEYVPQSAKGSLLYTTRNRDIGIDLTRNSDPIMIPSMSQEEAQQLLGDPLMSSSTVEDCRNLLEELDYLPLAITQAVAYMTKRRKSIPQYLKSFRESDSDKIHLLKHEFSDFGRGEKRKESLATTFVVSFDYLKKDHPDAADLLSMMSFFDRERILGDVLHGKDANLLDFDDAIGLLVAFSFVTEDSSSGRTFYSIHRLVHLATRAWLSGIEPDGGKALSSIAMQKVAENLHIRLSSFLEQSGDHVVGYISRNGLARTHLEPFLALQLQNPSKETRLAQATFHLACTLTWYPHSESSRAIAESHAVKALEIRIKILGPDHVETCTAMVVAARCKTLNNWFKAHRRTTGNQETLYRLSEDDKTFELLRRGLDGFYNHFELAYREAMFCIVFLFQMRLFDGEAVIKMGNSWFQELLERLDTLPDHGERASSDVCSIILNECEIDLWGSQSLYHVGQQLWERYHHVWSEDLRDEYHRSFFTDAET